jgi:hypothetical protein
MQAFNSGSEVKNSEKGAFCSGFEAKGLREDAFCSVAAAICLWPELRTGKVEV